MRIVIAYFATVIVLIERRIEVLSDAIELDCADRLNTSKFRGIVNGLGNGPVGAPTGVQLFIVMAKS